MAMKNTLNKNKSSVWLCSKVDELSWDEPKEYFISVMPATRDGEISVYGSSFPEYIVCYCTTEEALAIKQDDRLYYRKDKPTEHNQLQNKTKDANYVVLADANITLNTGSFRCRRIKDK